MGKTYAEIDDRLKEWVEKQPVYFVATAPLSAEGMVNCSPKGLDSLRVIGPTTVAYLDLTGSGIETVAHLRENGRIVIMFCAFEGRPNIIRFHGTGSVVLPGDESFAELATHFPPLPGIRSIIRIEVSRISDSCGFGVPLMDLQGPRDTLTRWHENKGPDGLAAYHAEKNPRSIDGLPGWEQDRSPRG